jgi:hypothetical protein
VFRYLKKVVHPRWRTPLKATKRLVGTVVVILSTTLVFIPIPLSNVVPALVIALISLAYLEEDGVLLSIALLATVIAMTVTANGRFAPEAAGRQYRLGGAKLLSRHSFCAREAGKLTSG